MIQKILKFFVNSHFSNKTYMGIEITDYAVKVVLLSNINTNRTKLINYAIEPLGDHCLEEGKVIDAFRLLQSIQIAVNRVNDKAKKAHFALPSPLVMVRFLKLPDLAKKEMNKLIEFEMKHNIHLPFEHPYYDYLKLNGQLDELRKQRSRMKHPAMKEMKDGEQQAAAISDPLFGLTTQTNDSNSTSTEAPTPDQLSDVMLVAAPGDRVDIYVKLIREAQVKLDSVEIRPLSLFRTIVKLDNNPTLTSKTFLLVDLGLVASDVSIFHDGKLKITRSIYVNFSQTQEDESIVADDDLLSLMNMRGADSEFQNACNEVVHELERLINFYRYTLNNRDDEFERIILTGDVARIREIRSFLEERLSRDVSIISCKNVYSDIPNIHHIFPSIATSFGLALRGEST